jgi:triosephosphate isomerase
MKRRFLIGNWKMNLPKEGIETYVREVARRANDAATIVVAPPFPYLKDVAGFGRGAIGVSAQNCADHASGAYTGEVSPQMIRDCGGEFVILGHSERRSLFGETDALIARKLALAIETRLTPVLCIGEDLRVREAGQVAEFLNYQVKAVASPALEAAEEIVIAYEPVWAIGTGRNASGEMVAETVGEIREALGRFWPSRHHDAPILYGGSVTSENCFDLTSRGNIDGYLVGGASLQSGGFLSIRDVMSSLARTS